MEKRIVWLDWLRVMACFMVMVVHSTEPFYLGGEGSLITSGCNAWWAACVDSFVRSCVPLFVIASSYLLFPVSGATVSFVKRRAVRILVPFLLWSVFYAFYWGEPVTNLKGLALNFNYAAGHLWFVYMLLGLYLVMPLLSPWAEKVGKKELSAFIGIWLLTTLIPLLRDWVSTEPLAVTFGPTGIPHQAQFPLWGEASWNSYGTFYYLSGFLGYLLIGLWFKKFGSGISVRKSVGIGIPCYLVGFAISAGGFLRRVYETTGGQFPFDGSVKYAIVWETTWGYDTIGVAMMSIGIILLMKNIHRNGAFFSRIVTPVSKASYGMYLSHMVALAFFSQIFRSLIDSTPLAILSTAVCSFVTVAIICVVVQKIPLIGKFIVG